MSTWETEIEQDLAWREAEMGALKLLLAAAPNGSDRERALLRACSAMIYAHFEGFSKFCWTLLLASIAKEAHLRRDLTEPLAKRAMAKVFKRVRGNTSVEGLWAFATTEFAAEMSEIATFPDDIDTQSNLWPSLFEEISASVGLQCPLLLQHSKELGQLVGRRNKIAHGEKLEIADLTQFRQFEHAAVLVMHELAIGVVEALDARLYLNEATAPVPTP